MGPVNKTVFILRMSLRLIWLLLPLSRDHHEYSLANVVVRKKQKRAETDHLAHVSTESLSHFVTMTQYGQNMQLSLRDTTVRSIIATYRILVSLLSQPQYSGHFGSSTTVTVIVKFHSNRPHDFTETKQTHTNWQGVVVINTTSLSCQSDSYTANKSNISYTRRRNNHLTIHPANVTTLQ